MPDQGKQDAQKSRTGHTDDFLSEPAEEQDSAINLMEVLATLKRGKRTVIVATLVCFLLATTAAFLIPFQYSSVATFIPPSSSSSSTAAALAGQLSALGAGGLTGGVKTSGDLYAGILRSRSIAEALIERFNLKQVYGVKRESDAVKRLAGSTLVEVGLKDSIITITVKDKSPDRARDLANAYLDELRDTNGRLALTESSQRRAFFDQQLAKEKNNLADAEVDLKRGEEQSGLIAPIGQTALGLETIANIKAQITARQLELTALRQSSTEQNPAVIRLHSVIADLEGQLGRLQSGSGNNGTGDIPSSKVPAVQLEYIRKAREVKYHEALFELIAKQDEAARMDEARDAPLLQVLDSASYPDRKSWPPRGLFMLGGIFFGLLIGFVWVLTRAYLQSLRSLFAPSQTLLRRQPPQ